MVTNELNMSPQLNGVTKISPQRSVRKWTKEEVSDSSYYNILLQSYKFNFRINYSNFYTFILF